ncbi:MAG: cation:proton antiporter [Woeseiaceae bacterium]|nr:cation:proton antiporter [Woeseiaceae bacterium]
MRLPQTLLLVVFGAIGAFVVTDVLDMDTGLRAANFPGVSHALVSLVMAYGTFLLAESLLEVSGIMATLLAVLLARLIMVFGASPLLNAIAREPLPIGHQAVIAWGGLRGAVTLALALALPTSLDYWWTIQSMAFGVVLFTLFVQAPTMPWLIRRAGVPQSENDDEPHEGSA